MESIWTMGEMLVEIMRPRVGLSLKQPAEFLGPYPSGSVAIFIDTVARLGHPAGIIGGVGQDDFGSCLLERLQADGVDTRFVEIFPGQATAVAFVTYFPDGSRKFIYHIAGTPAARAKFPAGRVAPDKGFFHVMGCSLMVDDPFRAQIIEAAGFFHAHGAKVSFDPNIRPELLGDRDVREVAGPILEHCSVMLPGEAELKLLGGTTESRQAVERLFASWPLELIVLKRGSRGSSIFSRESVTEVPAFRVGEVDPTGAGDCFDAAFLCGLLEGKPPAECGRMASAAGALNAAAFGPMEGSISQKTITRLIRGNQA
jgi:sugar/nucleoside kinase (ribokinase family)